MVSSCGLLARNECSCCPAPQVHQSSPFTLPLCYTGHCLPKSTCSFCCFVFFRCNIAVILLTDLIVDHGVKVEWSAYIHLLLHAIFIGNSLPTLNIMHMQNHVFFNFAMCVCVGACKQHFFLQICNFSNIERVYVVQVSDILALFLSFLQGLITSIQKSTNTANDCCFTCLLSKEQTATFSLLPWCFYATETSMSRGSSLRSR